MTKPYGVVLMNYGGPESLDEVRPYLENIFRDPLIITLPFFLRPLQPLLANFIAWRRAPYSRMNYESIGGKSPLNEFTELQRRALQALLAERGEPAAVVVAQRYWRPRAEAAVRELREAGIERAVLLPLYPQYADATTKSSILDFKAAWTAAGGDAAKLSCVTEYPVQPEMIGAMAAAMRARIAQIPEAELARTGLIFSAHGLPQAMIDRDPTYLRHVEAGAAEIVKALGWTGHSAFAFQSRVGPVKWLRPYPLDTLNDFSARGLKHAVVYPITFVSDHSETLYELDLLWGPEAEQRGIRWHRVPALNADPGYIRALSTLARDAARSLAD